MRKVRMEDEGKMDFFSSLNISPKTKSGVNKNMLRPIYNDDNQNYVDSGKTNKAFKTSGIPGSKAYHLGVAAELALVAKEDKCSGREKEFKTIKSNLGKKVRVGKMKIVKKADIIPPKKSVFKHIKPTKKTLKDVLRGL